MKKLLLGISLLAMGIGAISLIPTEAHALPNSALYTYYYSDDTHTTLVGHRFLECNGRKLSTGVTSDYYYQEVVNCNEGLRICSLCGPDGCEQTLCF